MVKRPVHEQRQTADGEVEREQRGACCSPSSKLLTPPPEAGGRVACDGDEKGTPMEGAVCRKVAETAGKPGKAMGQHRAVGLLPPFVQSLAGKGGRSVSSEQWGGLEGSGQDRDTVGFWL